MKDRMIKKLEDQIKTLTKTIEKGRTYFIQFKIILNGWHSVRMRMCVGHSVLKFKMS